MKKMLVILSMLFTSLLLMLSLCSCDSVMTQSELNTDFVNKLNEGEVIVEENISSFDGKYKLTYIYLKDSNGYIVMDNQWTSYENATGKYTYDITIQSSSNKKGVYCIDLIQYKNYIKVRLGNYYTKYNDGQYYVDGIKGELIIKTLIISNNEMSYEIIS